MAPVVVVGSRDRSAVSGQLSSYYVPQSLVISCTVSAAVAGHLLYYVRSLWSSPLPTSAVYWSSPLLYVRSLWSSPLLRPAVSGQFSSTTSAAVSWSSPLLRPQVSGHILYYVRSLWSILSSYVRSLWSSPVLCPCSLWSSLYLRPQSL
ncbi:unnamed protein product, partial [Staurois parvus]